MRVHTPIVFLTGAIAGAISLELPCAALFSSPDAPVEGPSVEEMLEDFVADFRHDPTAADPIVFGVRVADAKPRDWHVVVGGIEPGSNEAFVSLARGFPAEPVAFYGTDLDTLRKIHSGQWASLTAMGKALSTETSPLDMFETEGFEPDDATSDLLTRLSFHFWMRGFPEIVHFGDDSSTRPMHGGNGVLFYYQKGFRSGWFRVSPGQRINEDPIMQSNPFPSLVIGTRGELRGRIGGVECELGEGKAVWIGPGVTHEFWTEGDNVAEGVLVMFGDGA